MTVNTSLDPEPQWLRSSQVIEPLRASDSIFAFGDSSSSAFLGKLLVESTEIVDEIMFMSYKLLHKYEASLNNSKEPHLTRLLNTS